MNAPRGIRLVDRSLSVVFLDSHHIYIGPIGGAGFNQTVTSCQTGHISQIAEIRAHDKVLKHN